MRWHVIDDSDPWNILLECDGCPQRKIQHVKFVRLDILICEDEYLSDIRPTITETDILITPPA